MLEKDRTPQTSLSFEQLLEWVGRFTPQFKFRLMGARRQLGISEFDTFLRETFTVFRSLLVQIGQAPKGAERARKVFALMDAEYKLTPAQTASCAAGCSACCKNFPKQITDDEADLLAALVRDGAAPIDRTELKRQASAFTSHDATTRKTGSHSACLFLGPDNKCGVYADRPSVCRKYHVTSPAENCASPDESGVVPRIDLMPEMIVSAALSLPDNGIDFMPLQLARRLEVSDTE